MRTGTEQLGTVAPWFDIMNSRQKYWIRSRRWKAPEYSAEYPREPFPSLAEPAASLAETSCGRSPPEIACRHASAYGTVNAR